MIELPESVAAWDSGDFEKVLKREVEALDPDLLPLQQGLTYGSYAKGEGFSAVVLNVTEQDAAILAKLGIFYTGLVAGCACADDPTPENETNEYCEVLIRIDRGTDQVAIAPV